MIQVDLQTSAISQQESLNQSVSEKQEVEIMSKTETENAS